MYNVGGRMQWVWSGMHRVGSPGSGGMHRFGGGMQMVGVVMHIVGGGMHRIGCTG